MSKDWLKLKENHCPICDHEIIQSGKSDYSCLNCGFYCRYRIAQDIIAEIEVKKFDKETDEWLAENEN